MNIFFLPPLYAIALRFLYLFSYTLGESFLLRTIANCALDRGVKVCLSAPTGNYLPHTLISFPCVDVTWSIVTSSFQSTTLPIKTQSTGVFLMDMFY